MHVADTASADKAIPCFFIRAERAGRRGRGAAKSASQQFNTDHEKEIKIRHATISFSSNLKEEKLAMAIYVVKI